MAAQALEPRTTKEPALKDPLNAPTTDLVPRITDEERAAALAVLARFEALDLVDMLGLDDEGGGDE